MGDNFRVNSWTENDQYAADVVATRNGGFAVFWQSSGDQDGDAHGVFAQRYDARGVALGAERQVNGTTSGEQAQVALARLSDDRVVAVYMSYQSGVGTSIVGRLYDPDLREIGAALNIGNAPTVSTVQINSAPVVAALAGGGFVATWHTYSGSASNIDVVMQRFDADGNKLGAMTVVHNASNQVQDTSSVIGLHDGGYVVTWRTTSASGDTDPMARVFNADGTARTAQFLVADTSVGTQTPNDIITLADGSFLISYTSPDANGFGAYARRFAADGTATGDPILLADVTEPAGFAWTESDGI